LGPRGEGIKKFTTSVTEVNSWKGRPPTVKTQTKRKTATGSTFYLKIQEKENEDGVFKKKGGDYGPTGRGELNQSVD